MLLLVANLGSTSFKCCLFEASAAGLVSLGKASVERVTDYEAAIEEGLEQLRQAGLLRSGEVIEAVGFKTVLGHQLSGCVDADDRCIAALEAAIPLAPAHSPPYIEGIRHFREKLPDAHLVAHFETAFYQWVAEASRLYAVPKAWRDAGVVRHGFHGASHKYIAERSAHMMGREEIAEGVRNLYTSGPDRETLSTEPPLRVISCHLGGSSSVTGIRNGVAIGTSMGLSPQSGLPQNNRVGELDSMAIPFVHRQLGLSIDEIEHQLSRESGLLGLSGVSNDMRDIREAAGKGNRDAQLALEHYVQQIRHWIGSFLIAMGGCDAIVFTAGIGENDTRIRAAVLAGLEEIGIELDTDLNKEDKDGEYRISSPRSRCAVWVIPTNEEHVVATETYRHVSTNKPKLSSFESSIH